MAEAGAGPEALQAAWPYFVDVEAARSWTTLVKLTVACRQFRLELQTSPAPVLETCPLQTPLPFTPSGPYTSKACLGSLG